MKPSHRARFLSILAGAGSILLLTTARTRTASRHPRVRQGPPATPTAAAAAHSDKWDLTSRVIGDDGPDFCIHTAKVGGVYRGIYTIRQNGNTVSFSPADFIDWESYSGTLQGTSFTASNAPLEFGPANGMCAHYFQSSTLSGSFSPDFTRLTATETWSFRLDSGQVKMLTFQWSAVRR